MRAALLALALLAGCATTNPADAPITFGQALYLIREERAQREAFDKRIVAAVNGLHPPRPQARQRSTTAPVVSK